MNRTYKYLFKNIGILTISNFASKILIFLLIPLYTSALTVEEYGTYDLIITTVQIIFPIITLNVVDAVIRFLLDRGYSQKEVISIAFKYLIHSFFLVAMFLIINNQINFIILIRGLELLIFLYYITFVLNQFFIQFARGIERFSDLGIASILGTVSMLIANIVFLLIFKWNLEGFFVANILAQAIPVIYFIFRLNFFDYLIKIQADSKLKKDMLSYCVPLIFTIISWWINSTSSRYIVAFFCGIEANGILSIAYKIPSIINVIQSIFIQAWQVSAIKDFGEASKKFYSNILVYYNFILCIACSILISLSKPLATILYIKDFYIAWQYVPFLLVSIVFNSMAGFIGPILLALKDSKTMAYSAIYGSIINIILNLILIYILDIQGATIATMISSYVIYLLRNNVAKGYFYNDYYKNFYLMWLLLIIQSIFEIYTSYMIFEIVIMIILIFINKNIILDLVYRKYRI